MSGDPCPTCSGSGVIVAQLVFTDDEGRTYTASQTDPCPSCGGTGVRP